MKQDQKSNRYDSISNNGYGQKMPYANSLTHSHNPHLEMLFHLKRGSEAPKYCEVTAYDFMTFYDFTAYKYIAYDFRPYDFTTYILRPVENVTVSPIFFPNSIKGWTLFII